MSSKLPINLDDLLRQRTVEGDRIEYKAGWNPAPSIRTICAFANDFENLGGGYLVIGQDCGADGLPVFPPAGVPQGQLDRIQKDLLGFCNLIQPPYFPVLSLEEVEGRNLIVLWAPGGANRPYKAPRDVTAKHKEYRYFIRRYASTVEARGDDERELISLAADVPFDDRLNREAALDDLSRPLVSAFLREVRSGLTKGAAKQTIETLGRKMNIVGGPAEATKAKNVGLLFFTPEPRRFFPATQIDVVWLPEGPAGRRLEEKTFTGPLGRMTREALDYIQRNYLKETVLKHPKRPEAERFWNFPFAAVEEAVVNAVYHRSYEIREPVEVRITPDELAVLSFPGPDLSIDMKRLRAGKAVSRRYRNRRIGEFLKELDLTEGRATGIPLILKEMQANGSPKPQFETDKARASFLVRLPVHPKAKTQRKAAPEVTQEVTPQVTPQVAPQVAPQVRLVQVLTGSMTRQELQQALGLKDRKHFRETYLQPAIDEGLIRKTVPDKPTSRVQRYRLTEKGQKTAKAARRGLK